MSITSCMIVKNEERCILRCLESVVGLVDEMVIVDTGSTDGTKTILEQFKKDHPHTKVKLFDFEWINDFSAARNFALSKVTKEWVLIIDADEYLHELDQKRLKKDMRKYNHVQQPFIIELKFHYLKNGKTTAYPYGLFRLFKKSFGFQFKNKVHESLYLPHRPLQKVNYVSTEARLISDGYDEGLVDQKAKHARNIQLINDMLEKDPENGVFLFYLGRETSYSNEELGVMILKEAFKRMKDPEQLMRLVVTLPNHILMKFKTVS